MKMKQNNTNSRIEVEHLCVEFSSGRHQTKAVQDVSLSVQKGRITALVGESGSGKSVTALTIRLSHIFCVMQGSGHSPDG